MNSGIYQIVNIVNNHRYVGSSVDLSKREWQHFNSLRKNNHYNNKLQSVFNQYKKNSLVFSVLVKCPPEYVLKLEQWFIDNLKPEYNISKSATALMLGRTHSEKTKKQYSENRKGERNSFFGKHHSEVTKKLLSESRIGNKHHSCGKKYSLYHRSNISNSLKGKKKSNIHCINLSNALKGKGGRNVYCVELDMNFKTGVDAQNYLRSIGYYKAAATHILRCCRGKSLRAYGYKWNYLNAELIAQYAQLAKAQA